MPRRANSLNRTVNQETNQGNNQLANFKRRVEIELKQLKDPSDGIIAFHSVDDSLQQYRATIEGPPNTPYENRQLEMEIYLPCSDGKYYPLFPPTIKCISRIYHPNISSRGDICLDTLSKTWTPALSIQTTLISIISLLSDPNTDDFLVPEAAYLYINNRAEFNRRAQNSVKSLNETLFNFNQLFPNQNQPNLQAQTSSSTAGAHSLDHTGRFDVLEPLKEKVFENGESKETLPIIDQCLNYGLEKTPSSMEDLDPDAERKAIYQSIKKEGQKSSRENEANALIDILIPSIDLSSHLFAQFCLRMYTLDTYFYRELNMFLRQADESKLSQYAAIVRILWFYFDHPSSREIHSVDVYRGMELKPAMLEHYKKVVGSGVSFRWSTFSSTSLNQEIAKNHLRSNTLFTIHLIKMYSGHKKALDISNMSDYNYEEEVLLKPGIEFSVEGFYYEERHQRYYIELNAYV